MLRLRANQSLAVLILILRDSSNQKLVWFSPRSLVDMIFSAHAMRLAIISALSLLLALLHLLMVLQVAVVLRRSDARRRLPSLNLRKHGLKLILNV